MKQYSELNYLVRTTRTKVGHYEIAFALTKDELVRRTTNKETGLVVYQTVDLLQIIGEPKLYQRTPRVQRGLWVMVDATDMTPE